MIDEQAVELANLLAGIVLVDPQWDRHISGIALDSRQVQDNFLFIALVGHDHDGRDFIEQAITQGAVAIIAEKTESAIAEHTLQHHIPVFWVAHLAQKISRIASRFYGHPSRQMQVIGVTGTNGKTSCCYYAAQILDALEKQSAIIGTVGYGPIAALTTSAMTTPDAIALQRIFSTFRQQHISTVAMEVSSHALAQGRVKNIEFDVAVFTNLTRDHLDYHRTMEEYGEAKATLFQQFALKYAVLNADDPFTKTLKEKIPPTVKTVTYSVEHDTADVFVTNIKMLPLGMQAELHSPFGHGLIKTSLLGKFNIGNLLAVITSLVLLDYPLEKVLQALEVVQSVPGRMQTFHVSRKPLVIVDYAHTPDALDNALTALKHHGHGRLWCVFGCGGDRDAGKRPVMGRVAEQHADHIILTNDNPRHENPETIVHGILQGLKKPEAVIVEYDRAQAIAHAIEMASHDDIVLIAGKGHETYQQIGDDFLPFNDAKIVQNMLK